MYGTQLFTGLTFSLSVAFMKLFIQNEMLSFTPTTREKAGKQRVQPEHGPPRCTTDLLLARLTCWFERDFIDGEFHRSAHQDAGLREGIPVLRWSSRGKKSRELSGCELHVKGNHRYLFSKITFMSLLCAGAICGASTCVNPVKCGWFLSFFL